MSQKTDQKTLSALLYPVQSGEVVLPADAEIVFLNAQMGPELVPYKSCMTCVQGFRPDYDILQAAGFRVVAQPSDTLVDMVLCSLSKHKARALADIALGLSMLKPGGVLIFTGRNDTGAASLGKIAQKAGPVFQMSKYHHRIFWMERGTSPLSEICADWLRAVEPYHVQTIDAQSVPGIFGWNKVDKGSQLLAQTLDDRVVGSVADFGAGWGYLSREILHRCPGVKSLDVLEAEYEALQSAKHNVQSDACGLHFDWVDVTTTKFGRKYEWIICNPPFHGGSPAGKTADADIGLAFIRNAQKSLKLGGRLILVANRHLPYEGTIDKLFGAWKVIAEDNAFKVIEARLRG